MTEIGQTWTELCFEQRAVDGVGFVGPSVEVLVFIRCHLDNTGLHWCQLLSRDDWKVRPDELVQRLE